MTEVMKEALQIDESQDNNISKNQISDLQSSSWKQIVDLGTEIPLEQWEKVPTDLSIELKRYLYGKREKH